MHRRIRRSWRLGLLACVAAPVCQLAGCTLTSVVNSLLTETSNILGQYVFTTVQIIAANFLDV